MKVLGMFTDWAENDFKKKYGGYGGVAYYRLVKPSQYLGIDVTSGDISKFGRTNEEAYTKIFTQYDVLWLKLVDNALGISNALAAAEYFGKAVIIDSDDNHLTVRKGTTAYDSYAMGKTKRYVVSAELSLAKHVTVSTYPLKAAYTQFNKNITVLPNYNDVNDWKFTPKKHTDGKIRIGYMGSITHNADFELVIEPLRQILHKYPDVEIELLGLMTKDTANMYKKKFRAAKGRITAKGGTPTWEGYPELVSQQGWDIGIAPLISDDFNTCKSHIKWMEYAMYQIPCVASKVYPYHMPIDGKNTIQHRKTGMLASTTEEWVQCLSELIENEQLRRDIGRNAYDDIYKNWQWKDHYQEWEKVFKQYAI